MNTFDTFSSEPDIKGEIYDPVVIDQYDTPNRVLEIGRDWKVEITWQLTSDDPILKPVDEIDGTWNVRISVESLGPGFEGVVANVYVPMPEFVTSSKTGRTWKAEVTIPANVIPMEGIYQLATLITYHYPSATHQPGPTPDDDMPGQGKRIGPRGAMAGYVEGPLITFYSD